MDWDFPNNKPVKKDLFKIAMTEGGKMEKDAIDWITDKISSLIYDEMLKADESMRAALTAAMPMLSVAGIITFTSVAAKPHEVQKLQAQYLMLQASADFTNMHMKRIMSEIEDLKKKGAKGTNTEHMDTFLKIRLAMEDSGKMPMEEWIEKYGDLVQEIEEFKNRKPK
jgi:hypothetical protein